MIRKVVNKVTSYIKNDEKLFAQLLLDFIQESPSSFHAVEGVKKMLVPQGLAIRN